MNQFHTPSGVLTIKGERKKRRKKSKRTITSRSGGSARFSAPSNSRRGSTRIRIQASFEKGVLTIKLPKGAEAQKPEKKIAIAAK